ncbi:peptidylprolyl isomerase [Lysobacter daejeonensis GH1-9]|uniref:Periplasmic chaperone PpiD n=1 Tax=Lysobacter daejeonensis GH1-9 TaxID=1385517 RepID=A0A0A0EY84_9GAMM|nr:SurA N-terminal domain-containing protein [Lysobacter daejeonensis]KGM55474.1 peptidylprolyl isomerase [Lysobacter daejeonensis GH1-9]
MLQTLRDKTSGWFATIILGLLIVPFALFGLQDYMVQRTDDAVAKVDVPPTWWASAPAWWPASMLWHHDKITSEEFRTRFEQERQRRRQQDGEAFDAKAFESVANKREILESMIDEKLRSMASERAGLEVSDAQVRKAIQDVPAFQVDGKFNAQRYQLALASGVPPQSPRQFEDTVRDSLRQSLVVAGIAQSNFVTDAELDRLMRALGETRDASVLMMPPPAPDAAPVTDAEIKSWYDGHTASFRAKEMVSLEYVVLDGASLPPPPPADEATLRQRYEQEKGKFAAAEERLASHILVQVAEGADAATQKAAEAKATKLAAEAKAAGADFAAIARANSDDTGSKATGGELGWVSKGMMDPGFEEALFSMKAGEISGPVKSAFGWHVIQLREVKGSAQQPFEAVRDALAAEQAQADRERAFNDLSTRLVDLVYKNPSALAPAARDVGLPLQTIGPVARDSSEGIFANAAVKRAAFSEVLVQDGTVSDPIEIGPNNSVLIRVTNHTPERALPLAQVREQVIAAIRVDRAQKAALKEAEALVARIAAGETLEAVAASKQLAVQTLPGLRRGMPIPDAKVVADIFAAKAPAGGAPTPGKVALDDGRIALFAVQAVKPGNPAEASPQERAMLRQQLSQAHGMSDVDALSRHLRKQMKVTVVEANL